MLLISKKGNSKNVHKDFSIPMVKKEVEVSRKNYEFKLRNHQNPLIKLAYKGNIYQPSKCNESQNGSTRTLSLLNFN